MNQATTDGQRLTELESRLAFQDQALLELNDALVKQGEVIAILGRRLNDLSHRLQALEDRPDAPAAADERPPHY